MDINSPDSLDGWNYPRRGQSRLLMRVTPSCGIEFAMMTTVAAHCAHSQHAQWAHMLWAALVGVSPSEGKKKQKKKKIWPPWHGATSKHHRLPPVNGGWTAQLAASLTYKLSGGNQNKGEEREFPNVASSQLMSAFHWHFLITHMLWILTVICFYWLTDEKHAKKKKKRFHPCVKLPSWTIEFKCGFSLWLFFFFFFFFKLMNKKKSNLCLTSKVSWVQALIYSDVENRRQI